DRPGAAAPGYPTTASFPRKRESPSRCQGDSRFRGNDAGNATDLVKDHRASMTEPILTLTAISKSFPGVRALHEVALELYPGQVTALIGENGAGKSTLVKTMTGIYQPDSG